MSSDGPAARSAESEHMYITQYTFIHFIHRHGNSPTDGGGRDRLHAGFVGIQFFPETHVGLLFQKHMKIVPMAVLKKVKAKIHIRNHGVHRRSHGILSEKRGAEHANRE